MFRHAGALLRNALDDALLAIEVEQNDDQDGGCAQEIDNVSGDDDDDDDVDE